MIKSLTLTVATFLIYSLSFSQNVGIGTVNPTEALHVVGNKVLFQTNFVGIGTSTPTSLFTGFAMKTAANSFYGSYIDAGATGAPFYGYALNGIPKAYLSFASSSNSLEYHQTNDATPDFYINGNTRAVFNTGFVGIGTSTPTTGFTGFTMKTNANSFYGSYIDAGATGTPFYGYALNGVPKAYTTFSGPNDQFEYHHTADATPDFAVSNTKAIFPIQTFLGVGTSTPTTGFTGLTIKNNVNSFWGTYVDAGATGTPFYGYALNGVAKAYVSFNGTNNAFEYHQTSDATPDFFVNGNTKAVFNTGFVGIGTSTPTTGFTGFAMKTNANSFYGSYIDAGATGTPFYGYALNGVPKAYTTFSGPNDQFEYHHTADATPDFAVSNTKAIFPIQTFLGVGTSTPTTGFTGLTIKNNVNSFWGTYVDAGATGSPFYGYALNGVAKAYVSFNGTNNAFEYHQTSDATPDFFVNGNTKAVFNTSFVGIGTSTATTGSTAFALKNNATGYYGMYIDAGTGGQPFYGYAINGSAVAWTTFNDNNNNWELNYGGVRMSVGSTGNVGIGASPSATAKLDVGGTIHASNLNGGATTLSTDAAGNIIRTPSDATLKNKVTNISDALNKVLKMHGVTYNFIDENRFGSNRQMGFLAQELEQVVPEAVSSGGEYKSVNYQVLTALLAEAMKEQQQQIDNKQKENEMQQKQIAELVKRIENLEKKKK